MSNPVRAEVRAVLQRWADEFGDVDGLVYRGPGDFLLQHGQWSTPKLSIDRVPFGHCYGGAIYVAGIHWNVRYVEGVAVSPGGGSLIPHAWISRAGQHYEITWHRVGLAYLGVEFALGRADDCTWNGDASVLLDANRDWPLFRQRWTGEDWQREWPDNIRLELLRRVRDGQATMQDYYDTLRALAEEA